MPSTALFVCQICGKKVRCIFIHNRKCDGRCFLDSCVWEKAQPEIILTDEHEACKNPDHHHMDGHA
ncbi:MAG: hypothetical protein NTY33_02670 [Candidatus Moranbacteria bacterium]|nr:hypothetical protein [Candidatus Moranbacteria bacterium]